MINVEELYIYDGSIMYGVVARDNAGEPDILHSSKELWQCLEFMVGMVGKYGKA